MPRDLCVYLWDIEESVDDILAFTRGKIFIDYQNDRLLRAAVERKFGIIGEALVRVAHHFPVEVERIEGYRQLIGFRNILSHQYDLVDDASVWQDIEAYLPDFRERIRALREEFDLLDPLDEQ